MAMLWGTIFLTAVTTGGGGGADKAGDVALVAAAQRGDADAFAKLHARYYRRIYHLAYLKTNNASDAEDVASETFIRALSGLSRFRFGSPGSGQTSFYPWLHRIAVNLVIDSARQRPPSGIVSLDAPVVEGMRSLLGEQLAEAGAASPQEIIERREVQQLVRGAIAALPTDQGDVLVYRFLGELSAQEMAPLLGRSEAATKSLLHRAVIALRAEIERRLEAIERLESGRERAGSPRWRECSVSDELPDERPDASAPESLPRGVTQLVESALRSPNPRPEAETAAQERAQAAYRQALRTPRLLHPDPWRSGPRSLTARLAQFLRRLRGG